MQRASFRNKHRMTMVRAEGVEPTRAVRLYGFSYRLRLSPPWRGARQRQRRVCGLDYPFTISRIVPGLRRYPSSLYTFPGVVFRRGLARDCHCRVPRIWAVLHRWFPGEHSSFDSSPLRLPFRHARVNWLITFYHKAAHMISSCLSRGFCLALFLLWLCSHFVDRRGVKLWS